jgi:hypothetical protein
MDFLKKTANNLKEGVELEMLKGERRKLKSEIKDLQYKIDTHNEQVQLKSVLSESLERTNQTLVAVGALGDAVQSDSAKAIPAVGGTDKGADEGDDKLLLPKIFSDPNTFKYTKKASYSSLVKHRDEIKATVERLTKIIETGLDVHHTEIASKQQRINEINERLKVIRQK